MNRQVFRFVPSVARRVFLFSLFLLLYALGDCVSSQERTGTFQCHAANFFMLDDFRSGTKGINSPDHVKRVTLAKDFTFRILNAGKEIGRIEYKDLYSNAQIIWAPDSEKFSITYSSGGAIGNFRVHMYRIEREAVIELLKPPETAFDDFRKQYFCKIRGNNIRALGWQADSRAIFLIAGVYPTSDCGEIWEQEAGYLVDMDGSILRRFNNRQTKRIEQACWNDGQAVLPSSR